MRASLRTSGGRLLLRGDLFVSPVDLQQALAHSDVVFDTRPDAEAGDPAGPWEGDPAAAAQPLEPAPANRPKGPGK